MSWPEIATKFGASWPKIATKFGAPRPEIAMKFGFQAQVLYTNSAFFIAPGEVMQMGGPELAQQATHVHSFMLPISKIMREGARPSVLVASPVEVPVAGATSALSVQRPQP